MKSALKIVFVSWQDPHDRHSFSGTHFQMFRALKENFTHVTYIGDIRPPEWLRLLVRGVQLTVELISSRAYHTEQSILLSRYYAWIIRKKLKDIDHDLIFAPVSQPEIALLHIEQPVVYYSDSSFNQLRDYYDYFRGLSTLAILESNWIEKKALQNSKLIIHASKWASDYVVNYYKVDRQKTHIIPMGANMDLAPPASAIGHKLQDMTTCRILFLGVDWPRKGGEKAFETFLELNKMGIDAHLTVCGCIPPERFRHSKMTVIPFLNKNEPAQYELFDKLLNDSHFLVLPTKAEAQGIVFCEASAYGVPSITADTGGISAAVENGINGYRLPADAGGYEYASLIKSIFQNEKVYKELVYQSRMKYEQVLNWHSWGRSIATIIQAELSPDNNGND